VIRRLFIPGTALILLAVSTSAQVRPIATGGRVTGVVRNSQGVAETGAVVELMKPDFRLVAEAATDQHGRYEFRHIKPGVYDLKATSAFFLPTLRERVQIEGATRMVVNMTLNTVYEAFRWLPAEPRSKGEPPDDWNWTLRLAANRPLLRMLQNGPLVVVADGRGHRSLEARVTIRGGAGGFGEGGIHQNIEIAHSSEGSLGMVLRADLADPGQFTNPSFRMVAGYERRAALNNSFRSVGVVEDHPEIAAGPGGRGLSAFALRSAETMDLMPGVEAEVGDEILGLRAASTIVGNYPFASFSVRNGATRVSYSLATSPDAQRAGEMDEYTELASMASESGGRLLSEHGLHQAVEISHSVGQHGNMSVSVYHDNMMNPVVSGGGAMTAADLRSGDVLYDPMTQLMSAAGQEFTSTGMTAEFSNQVLQNLWMTLNVATGNALAYTGDGSAASIAEQLHAVSPRASEMVAISATGRLVNAGTQWRVGYSWQGGGTLTQVAAFDTAVPGPYLSVFVKQPIRCRHMLPNGMEAMVAVRNLLAEGYRPFLSSDGTTLYFAQVSRSVEGGVSFTF
jgi:hypothetical protein